MLIVEDYAPFRRFVVSILQKQQGLQIICEVPDGLESVQKAEELLPDLVLLDIGLPNLNGIEAAQRICKISPQSKILFLSENRSWDIVEEALRSGACGYVVKSDAESELLPAVKAVLKGSGSSVLAFLVAVLPILTLPILTMNIPSILMAARSSYHSHHGTGGPPVVTRQDFILMT